MFQWVAGFACPVLVFSILNSMVALMWDSKDHICSFAALQLKLFSFLIQKCTALLRIREKKFAALQIVMPVGVKFITPCLCKDLPNCVSERSKCHLNKTSAQLQHCCTTYCCNIKHAVKFIQDLVRKTHHHKYHIWFAQSEQKFHSWRKVQITTCFVEPIKAGRTRKTKYQLFWSSYM